MLAWHYNHGVATSDLVWTGTQTQIPFLKVFTAQNSCKMPAKAISISVILLILGLCTYRTGIKQLFPSLRSHCSAGLNCSFWHINFPWSYFSMCVSLAVSTTCAADAPLSFGFAATIVRFCLVTRLQSLSLVSPQSDTKMMLVFLVYISGEVVNGLCSVIFAQPLCGNIKYFKHKLRNLFCSRVSILKHVSVFLQVKKVPSNIFLMF